MLYKAVLFDFGKVLCFDNLFVGLEEEYPITASFIQEEVFNNKDIFGKWMRGCIDINGIINYIINNTAMDFDTLYGYLIQSIENMYIDKRLIELAKDLKSRNIKVALVTDNLDVFNFATVHIHKLDEIFPVIVNSCDYGKLKSEPGGLLFDVVLEKLEVSSYEEILLIDDSLSVKKVFEEEKGGKVFTYEGWEKFEPWMKKNLL